MCWISQLFSFLFRPHTFLPLLSLSHTLTLVFRWILSLAVDSRLDSRFFHTLSPREKPKTIRLKGVRGNFRAKLYIFKYLPLRKIGWKQQQQNSSQCIFSSVYIQFIWNAMATKTEWNSMRTRAEKKKIARKRRRQKKWKKNILFTSVAKAKKKPAIDAVLKRLIIVFHSRCHFAMECFLFLFSSPFIETHVILHTRVITALDFTYSSFLFSLRITLKWG